MKEYNQPDLMTKLDETITIHNNLVKTVMLKIMEKQLMTEELNSFFQHEIIAGGQSVVFKAQKATVVKTKT